MPTVDTPATFTRLADGTILLRQEDGSFRPVHSETDHARFQAMSDEETERAGDPDHPALDDAFWAIIDATEPTPHKEAISIKLDDDVLSYFRRGGRGYQTRINAVLRRYMEAVKERR